MDKFSELKSAAMAATPGPWEWFTSNSMARLSSTPSGKDGDVLSSFRASDGVPCVSVSQYDMAFIAAANPAAVLELLAELEAKDEQNKLLMREVEHGKKLRVNMQNNADSLSDRIGELEAIATDYAGKFQKAQDALKYAAIMSDDDKKKIAELEKRLATPVRLPLLYSPDPWMSPDPDGTWLDKEDVKKSIRDAGFTVEGDE